MSAPMSETGARQHPQPAVSGTAQSGLASVSPAPVSETLATPPPIVNVKTNPYFLPVLAAIIGAAVSVVLLAMVLLAVLGGSRTDPWPQNNSSFCCSDEALAVLRVVNLSVDPCEDFYAHVCSRVDAGTVEHLSPMIAVAMKRKLLELSISRAGTSAAGQMLAALNKRSHRRMNVSGEEIRDYVTAIAQVAAIGQQVNIFHVVRLFAELSMRYGLQSLLSFSVSGSGTTLMIHRNNGCDLNSAHKNDVGPATDAFNKALNDTVDVGQLRELHDKLRSTQGVNHSKTESRSIALSPFIGLSDHEWAAISRDLIFTLHPNVKAVETRKEDRLNDFLNVLVKAPHQRAAFAYIVVCTAFMTRENMHDILWMEPARGKEISCHRLAVCEVEDIFFAEAFSSRYLNSYVRDLFRNIRVNVIGQASGHILLSRTSKQDIAGELDQLRLMLPEEIAASDVRVPTVSKKFIANLLAARSCVFDVRKAKISRKVPSASSLSLPAIVRRDDVIYIPTNVYALLGEKPKKHSALGIPVLGVDMAAEMWAYLLERPWPDETRRNIKTRLECFTQRLPNVSHHGESLRTAAIALGVESAMNAVMTAEWNTVAVVNGTETSLGRLVYLSWVYNRCDAVPEENPRFDVNSALQYSSAFGEAFGCVNGSGMTSQDCCFKSC